MRFQAAEPMSDLLPPTLQFEGTEEGYDNVRYTRCNNNPSQTAVAAHLAALEGTEAALPVASGMAAISSTLLALLEPGAHILIVRGPYGKFAGRGRRGVEEGSMRMLRAHIAAAGCAAASMCKTAAEVSVMHACLQAARTIWWRPS
jgi:hypothetical protein